MLKSIVFSMFYFDLSDYEFLLILINSINQDISSKSETGKFIIKK